MRWYKIIKEFNQSTEEFNWIVLDAAKAYKFVGVFQSEGLAQDRVERLLAGIEF